MSLPGKSLTASLVFRNVEGAFATRLTSVSSVAAVIASGGRGPLIKWPNDLVYGGGKMGGILAESFTCSRGEFSIVGIGMNVNLTHEDLEMPVRLPATSLLVEEGRRFEIGELLDHLLREVEARETLDEASLLEEYRGLLAYRAEMVSVVLPGTDADRGPGGRRLTGLLEGVDDDGSLLLSADGNTVRVVAGEWLTPVGRYSGGG